MSTSKADAKAETWQEWTDKLWESMTAQYGYCGLAVLEQYMLRSRKEHRCIECGAAGTVQQKSHIVPSVDHYFMCSKCDDYWKKKGK